MIPARIHYCWFGGQTKPDLMARCIASFKHHCPEFEVVEWNEQNFDISRHPFAAYAASRKKWAFVSDVCRALVLKHQGGFFLDADNELTAGIQQFRNFQFVSGFESYMGVTYPITAFMGAEPNSDLVDYMIGYYGKEENFKFDSNTKFISEHLIGTRGFIPDNTLQLRDDTLIAPNWYFCTPVKDKRNYCIHHFNGSWVET